MLTALYVWLLIHALIGLAFCVMCDLHKDSTELFKGSWLLSVGGIVLMWPWVLGHVVKAVFRELRTRD